MASYRDYEKLWAQYQKEGVPRDISIELYCRSKGIVYAHFERWYRAYFRRKAYEVEITNIPERDVINGFKSTNELKRVNGTRAHNSSKPIISSKQVNDPKRVNDPTQVNDPKGVNDPKLTNNPKRDKENEKDTTSSPPPEPITITKIDLRLSNGIEYHAEQVTSKVLTSLITKLEALCLD